MTQAAFFSVSRALGHDLASQHASLRLLSLLDSDISCIKLQRRGRKICQIYRMLPQICWFNPGSGSFSRAVHITLLLDSSRSVQFTYNHIRQSSYSRKWARDLPQALTSNAQYPSACQEPLLFNLQYKVTHFPQLNTAKQPSRVIDL